MLQRSTYNIYNCLYYNLKRKKFEGNYNIDVTVDHPSTTEDSAFKNKKKSKLVILIIVISKEAEFEHI